MSTTHIVIMVRVYLQYLIIVIGREIKRLALYSFKHRHVTHKHTHTHKYLTQYYELIIIIVIIKAFTFVTLENANGKIIIFSFDKRQASLFCIQNGGLQYLLLLSSSPVLDSHHEWA